MNKGLTLLILGVVVCAMGLVFYTNMDTPPADSAAQTSTALPAQANATVQREALASAEPLPEVTPPPAVSMPAGSDKPQTAQQPIVPQTPVRQSAQEQPKRTVAQTPIPQSSAAEIKQPVHDAPATLPAPVVEPPKTEPQEAQKSVHAKQDAIKPVKPAEPETQTKLDVKKLSLTASHEIKSLGVHFAGQQMKIRIEATDPFPCKYFVLNSPDRLVIDLPGTWKGVTVPKVPDNKIIKGARVGKQDAGPRIVLDLNNTLKTHKIERPSDNVVEIFIN